VLSPQTGWTLLLTPKVTQEELADYAGLSRVSVMKVEKGGDVRLSNLLRLIELLGLELVVRPRGLK